MPRVAKSFNVNDMVRRYKAGESEQKLAIKLGVSRRVISNRLLNSGIVRRGIGEATRLHVSQLTKAQVLKKVVAAHDAVRGKRQSDEHRRKIAAFYERAGKLTVIEQRLFDLLTERGLKCIGQKAIDRYNIDVAICEPPIAVEVFGGHWHAGGRHARRHGQRAKAIFDAGHCLVCIWITKDYPLQEGAVDYLVRLAELLRRDPSSFRQQHMIRGDGKATAIGKRHLKDVA